MEKLLGCQVNVGREHKRITDVTVTPRVLGTGRSGWGKKASLKWGKKANELGCVILWKAFSSIPESVGCTFIHAFLAPEDCVSMCQDYPWPYLV